MEHYVMKVKRVELTDENGETAATLTAQKLTDIDQRLLDDQSRQFLDKLYDHSKQLVSLSTGVAAIFVALSGKQDASWGLFGSLVLLAFSGAIAMGMLTRFTRMIGRERPTPCPGEWLFIPGSIFCRRLR